MNVTLEQLEGDVWPEPDVRTSLIETCHRLRKVPIDSLDTSDIRMLLTQRIGVRHLIDPAIRILEVDPMVDASFFPGDLLIATLRADNNRFRGFPTTHSKLSDIARRARKLLEGFETIPQSIAELPSLLDEYTG